MKKFTCNCIGNQFNKPENVYVDFSAEYGAEIPCIYRPNGKSVLRRIKLEPNYCPMCGARLEGLQLENNRGTEGDAEDA